MNPSLSVIIPAYNEEKAIGQTLRNVLAQSGVFEIIVVDGGSSDKTAEISGEYATVVHSQKGRAAQLNAGANQARADILLFLHADTILPENAIEKINKSMQSGFQAGRFRMQFDEPLLSLKIFAFYTRFHFFSYGDQAFFVTRDLFDRLNGFKTNVPFEDIDFYKRLRKLTRPAILKDKVTTSARRFVQTGCMRQKWINLFLVFLYYCGINVLSLKNKHYPDIR